MVNDNFIDDGSEEPDNHLGLQPMTDSECSIVGELCCFSLEVDRRQGKLLLYGAHSCGDLEAARKQFDKLLVEQVNFGAKRVQFDGWHC